MPIHLSVIKFFVTISKLKQGDESVHCSARNCDQLKRIHLFMEQIHTSQTR